MRKTEIENGNKEDGIRAIFLYPMNALVNDQMDRVREILKNCPEIKFGYFTGDTKETVSADYRYKYEQENNVYIPSNELVSREEIRKTPPHLLFTNYSMLEYLLIRPNDYSIFSSDNIISSNFFILAPFTSRANLYAYSELTKSITDCSNFSILMLEISIANLVINFILFVAIIISSKLLNPM